MPTDDERGLGAHRRRGSATCPAPSTATSRRCARGIAEGIVPAVRQVREVAVQARQASRGPTASSRRSPQAQAGDGELPETLRRDLGARRRARPPRYGELADFLERRARSPRAARGRRRPRHLRAAVAALPRRHHRPRRDLRVGHRGARAHGRRAGVASRARSSPGHPSPRPSRSSTPTRRASCTAPTRCSAGCRRPATAPSPSSARRQFDIPDRDPHARVHDRADPGGRHLLHGPERRLHPPRPDVVVRARGRHRVRHLARAHHRLPRGRARATTCRSARPSSTAAQLNTWRRQLAGTSGHAEGWALYAERLMEELGYLDDPADRLGMLDGQRMRAARVVLDIGVHLGKQRPDGDGPWTGEYAFEFLRAEREHERRVRALRGEPLPRLARAGAVVQGRPAHLGAAARRGRAPRGRRRSTSGSSTSGRSTSAASASTPCARRCSPDRR